MNNHQVFFNINIKQKQIDFLINSTNESNPIFLKNYIVDETNGNQFLFSEKLEIILKKTILEMEKTFNVAVDRVNLMIEDGELNTIDVTLKENFENKNINKATIEYLLQDIKQQIAENHPEKKIIHIIIKKCFMDGEEYNKVPFGSKCKNFVMDISFIYLKKSILSKLRILMKNHQIEIDKIICTNYAKSLLNYDINDLSRAGLAAIDDSNLNEVGIYSKKIRKLGFFEKLFHIFT
tara:strand:+ start:831 stop:1538 length:708 start_codon:yes stop_codon:yes gene_type:complete